MKKFLVLACAGSVLALASAANAGGSYDLTVQGSIAQFCNITTAGGAVATFTGFDNGTGGVTDGIGVNTALNVSANAKCDAKVSSAHGGLLAGATTIPYKAGMAYNAPAVPVNTVIQGDNPLIDLAAATMPTVGDNTLNVKVLSVGAAGPFPVATYSDTLTVTVTASL